MKARELLEEIRENIKDYDVGIFKKRLDDENTDETSKLRANSIFKTMRKLWN